MKERKELNEQPVTIAIEGYGHGVIDAAKDLSYFQWFVLLVFNHPTLRRFPVSNTSVCTPLRSPINLFWIITMRGFVAGLWGCVLALAITYVETAIYQNHITGVNNLSTAGQLVPMFVGIMGFLVVIYHRLKEEREKVGLPKQALSGESLNSPLFRLL